MDWQGRQQLQHVDMIFRLYLPLYALLRQTDRNEDQQVAIKELLLDVKVATFVRNLMKGVPNRDEEGQILLDKSESTFSQVIAQFLSSPNDIVNN